MDTYVEIEGKEYPCPDWANYLTQEKDGKWVVFKEEPYVRFGVFCQWLVSPKSHYYPICYTSPPKDFTLELYILEE